MFQLRIQGEIRIPGGKRYVAVTRFATLSTLKATRQEVRDLCERTMREGPEVWVTTRPVLTRRAIKNATGISDGALMFAKASTIILFAGLALGVFFLCLPASTLVNCATSFFVGLVATSVGALVLSGTVGFFASVVSFRRWAIDHRP